MGFFTDNHLGGNLRGYNSQGNDVHVTPRRKVLAGHDDSRSDDDCGGETGVKSLLGGIFIGGKRMGDRVLVCRV